MFKSFARTSALIAAAAFAGGCDTSTRAPQGGNALTSGAPAAAPAANPNPNPNENPNRTQGTSGTDGTSGTSGTSGTNEASVPGFREVTIPAGTVLAVRLNTSVASDTSRPEQRIDGTLTRDVRIGGIEALGAGAALGGIVTNARRSARVKGRASVGFRFNQLTDAGQTYSISTRTITREAPGTKKRDAATIGIPAAGGAIVGGIIGGGDGAVKGGVIGGAAGGAAVLSTRGKEVRLAPGTSVSVRLASPLTVRVAR